MLIGSLSRYDPIFEKVRGKNLEEFIGMPVVGTRVMCGLSQEARSIIRKDINTHTHTGQKTRC